MLYHALLVLMVALISFVMYCSIILLGIVLLARFTDGVWWLFIRNSIYQNKKDDTFIMTSFAYHYKVHFDPYTYPKPSTFGWHTMDAKIFRKDYKRISKRKADKLLEADKALNALAEL